MITENYQPPYGLGNRHLQTILSSVGPRRLRVRKAYARHQQGEQEMLLSCHDGIRLSGIWNRATSKTAPQLVILIHGWEGSASSSYMLSMTTKLLNAGIDVFRLNLRDHGDTHHLNEGIFNSTLVAEVISGLHDLQARLDYQQYTLVGFSLGGNFALRVAALADDSQVKLARVVAFCPALHAARSNAELNAPHNYIYGQYFVRKWKRSLYKKLEHFPHYEYRDSLSDMKTLDEMNHKLVPVYTPYASKEDYFEAYAITGDVLASTICPCYLHFARDDMMIPYQDIELLADNPDLHITVTEKGGHCGFLMNWKLDSWQDYRVLDLVTR
ncbi:MAG: alpha/beta fold hydrolase [Gammaproteobacteria bacterium]|nr:alpha/beta fold hydrolase [Gammaproteobacteria bacterium]